MTGIDLIAAERQRQIEDEGWTPEHDDEHGTGELAQAAACYADPDLPSAKDLIWTRILAREERLVRGRIPHRWPWHPGWWKPTPDDRIRELVKAGALIAAEIDRLQRLPASTPEGET